MPSTGSPPSVVPLRPLALALAVLAWGLVLAGGAPASAAPTPAATAPPDHADAWEWPVEGPLGPLGPPPTVLRGFDPPAQTWLAGHRGVDLAADAGAEVRSAGAGVVVFSGWLAGRGVVSIDHDGGLRTTYEPVDPVVVAGEPVGRGEPIGELEPLTAHCATTCLHWGLKRGDTYLDPLSLVRPHPPVLLPYGPPVFVGGPAPGLSPWWLG
jgi:murein DD-endopeptidase MepM/ murein hydrolase activator NlpD